MMSWKIIWQALFILSVFMLIVMFVKFTVSGYKDIKEMLNDKK